MESTTEQQVASEVDEQLLHIKGVVESLLFVNEKPVTLDQIKKVLDTANNADIKKVLSELQCDYEDRKCGIMIVEIAGGYQMMSNPIYASYLRSFYKTKHKEKLSKPALESMAIIAYKQPVTRSDIEVIRCVNSDGVVVHLLNKDLIKVIGRKDVPGRPFVYGTTKQFLEYFGLKSLDDLPTLEEFPSLQPSEESILPVHSGEEQEESKDEQEAGDVSNREVGKTDGQEELNASEDVTDEVAEENQEQVVENESEKSS